MKVGSDEHAELFCREFVATHNPFEPERLPWPELDDPALALLRGIPFWSHALHNEEHAGPLIAATAARESDPTVRSALELQAYEETRHARILHLLFARYGVEFERMPTVPDSRRPDLAFADFGFEECLDSFGAFGMFRLARESIELPEEIFEIFERVMQEEARHIVFFLNWFAWHEARRGRLARALRPARALWHYAKAAAKLASLAVGERSESSRAFTITGAQAFVDDLEVRTVLATCLAENERRLRCIDPRLLRPRLAPASASTGLAVFQLFPRRRPR
jgi:hypothetical protein